MSRLILVLDYITAVMYGGAIALALGNHNWSAAMGWGCALLMLARLQVGRFSP